MRQVTNLGMGFSFYPLRRLILFTFVSVSRITFVPSDFSVLISFNLTFVHSFDVGKINGLRTFSFHQLFNFSFLPTSWRLLFNFQRYHTVAKLLLSKPLSTPWHFTCQLLFVVAKVIYSASVLLLWRTPRFRHLSFSFYFHLSD